MATSRLGDYLRARRDQVRPDQVGLPVTGPRRVAGLRREEVALLARVSVDYYIRLEQGRERNPSVQVLEALADVLRLDDDARMHLCRLAGLAPRSRRRVTPERVDPSLLSMMDSWSAHPAVVLGRAYDILAANQLGRALYGDSANLAEKVFLEPESRTFYVDWARVARGSVAGFRLLYGDHPDDPRIRAVLDGLLRNSPEFGELWEHHDARAKVPELKRLLHPQVGELELHVQAFDLRSAPGQQLIVYHAEPGSASAQSLALLGSLAVTVDSTPSP